MDELQHQFTYQAPSSQQVQDMQDIRDAARRLGELIVARCPASADRSAAVRKLRECVMTANASIVLAPRETP